MSEKISTHHVSLPYILYVDDDLDLVADDQHRAIRWFDLEEVSQSCEHHKYMNHYAGWVLEDLRRKEKRLKAVIMAGGSGTRLWPLSRAGHPKQFLSLHSEKTMLQSTVDRLSDLPVDSTITICNEEHRFFVAEQLRELGHLGMILLEPVGRNTAPAVALAALSTCEEDPLLLVLAADHVITDKKAFTRSIEKAVSLAEAGKLVTFGIVPTEAHTGYGYIETGDEFEVGFEVNSFKKSLIQKRPRAI